MLDERCDDSAFGGVAGDEGDDQACGRRDGEATRIGAESVSRSGATVDWSQEQDAGDGAITITITIINSNNAFLVAATPRKWKASSKR